MNLLSDLVFPSSECKYDTDNVQRCVSVVAQENRSWEGKYLQTTVEVTETVISDFGYQIRNIRCPTLISFVAPTTRKQLLPISGGTSCGLMTT